MRAALSRFAAPTYAVAALLVGLSLVDYASNVWPPLLGEVRWRFGAIGLFANFLLTPLLGMWLAALVAQLMQHRRAARVIAVADLAAALLLVILSVEFVLAGLELRPREVPPAAVWTFNVGIAKGVLKYLLVSGVLGWLSLAGLKGAGSGEVRAADATSGQGILVRHTDTEAGR